MMMKAAFSVVTVCITLLAAAPPVSAQTAPRAEGQGDKTREILSISWQPGYCVTRRKSKGCEALAGAAAARQFSLHGLWQPRGGYCGVEAGLKEQARKGKWSDLPALTLEAATRTRLEAAMPATRVGLDRRQWLRGGICLDATPEAYYTRALDMLDRINASPVRALFSGRAGGEVTLAEVRAAFDAAFGAGAGERVRLTCRKAAGRDVVVGLTVGLGATRGDLAGAIGQARPTRSRCTGGATGMAKQG